jgi:magnesium-transporting ATPase (P-type)
MSVVCKNEFDSKFRVFVKGSPEMIGALCLSDTIPSDFKEILDIYTKEGYRVIALATKVLPE